MYFQQRRFSFSIKDQKGLWLWLDVSGSPFFSLNGLFGFSACLIPQFYDDDSIDAFFCSFILHTSVYNCIAAWVTEEETFYV